MFRHNARNILFFPSQSQIKIEQTSTISLRNFQLGLEGIAQRRVKSLPYLDPVSTATRIQIFFPDSSKTNLGCSLISMEKSFLLHPRLPKKCSISNICFHLYQLLSDKRHSNPIHLYSKTLQFLKNLNKVFANITNQKSHATCYQLNNGR